jgi:hypothetical protein
MHNSTGRRGEVLPMAGCSGECTTAMTRYRVIGGISNISVVRHTYLEMHGVGTGASLVRGTSFVEAVSAVS